MSINVYLKGDEVQKIQGFVTKVRRDKNQEWNEYLLPGIELCHNKGRWYTILNDPTEPVPAAIADIVEGISLHEWIYPPCPNREAGIYRYESAEAEVEPNKSTGMGISIRAKKMEHVLELYRKIRIGSIRPEYSYEGQQGDLSRAELKAKLESANSALKSLRVDLQAFCVELQTIGWSFCIKKTVSNRVEAILKSYSI